MSTDCCFNCGQDAGKLEAEIERLKEELNGWEESGAEAADLIDNLQAGNSEKDAEIERLRGVEMKLQGTLKNQVMINDELRSRLEVAEMEVAEHERCVSSYEEEIETLRALDESLSRERDDLRSRLDAAIEPGSEEALKLDWEMLIMCAKRNKKFHGRPSLHAVEKNDGWHVCLSCSSRILRTLIIECSEEIYEQEWSKDGEKFLFGLRPDSAQWVDFTGVNRDVPITYLSL